MNNIESAKAQIEDAKARNIPLMAVTPAYMDTLISELEGAKFAAKQHLQTVETQARILDNGVPSGYRLLPVTLAPHIRDALVETGKCFMPDNVWDAIIDADKKVNPQPPQVMPTANQLIAQLECDERWTAIEQNQFAVFLQQFPNESAKGIQSLGSAWKYGKACAQPQASAAPVLTDAALGPIPWAAVNQAIKAVGDEARERGKMYPQTSDEQQNDRAAVKRVMGMIEWYATNGSAVAERLPDWPHAIQSGDSERLDFLDRNAKYRMGWKVTVAPAGNLGVQSIISGGNPIRFAIDEARHLAATPAKTEEM